jgi:hypothetical protein
VRRLLVGFGYRSQAAFGRLPARLRLGHRRRVRGPLPRRLGLGADRRWSRICLT